MISLAQPRRRLVVERMIWSRYVHEQEAKKSVDGFVRCIDYVRLVKWVVGFVYPESKQSHPRPRGCQALKKETMPTSPKFIRCGGAKSKVAKSSQV